MRSSDAGGVMTVAFERDHAAFTAFEREIGQAGVAAIQPWIEAALPRSSDVERRGTGRSISSSISSRPTPSPRATGDDDRHGGGFRHGVAGSAASWVARIRARLRAGDRAGMLSDREIAVLLYGRRPTRRRS